MITSIVIGLILGVIVAFAAHDGLRWALVNWYEQRLGMSVWRCKQVMIPMWDNITVMWHVSISARVWRLRTWYRLAVFGCI